MRAFPRMTASISALATSIFCMAISPLRRRVIPLPRPDRESREALWKTVGVDPNGDSAKLSILAAVGGPVTDHVLISEFRFKLLACIAASKDCATGQRGKAVQPV